MAIRPDNIKKVNNTRLYHVTGKWIEKDQTYRQDFMIAAKNEQDALQIGKNHIPLKIIQSGTNSPEFQVRDYGIPQSNRTYYSSPILPNTYKPVMPGPIERIPVAENSVEDIDLRSPETVVKKITPQPQQPEPVPETPKTEEPKQPEPTPGMSPEEYYWASYFSVLWGTQLGKVLHYGKKMTRQEHDILVALQTVPDYHLIMQEWAKEYMSIIKEKNNDSDAHRNDFFKAKTAELIDQYVNLSEGDKNHEKK